MAGPYIVKINRELGGGTFKDGVDSLVVWAEDATTAIDLAQCQVVPGSGVTDAGWAAATATALAAAADFVGWRMQITLSTPPGGAVNVTVTGTAGDAMDDIGDLAVIALNATADIAAAAYATPNLTISAAGDGNGDDTATVAVFPPLLDADFPQNDVPFTSLIGAIVHEGASGDAVTVALDATAPVPALHARLRQ